MKPQELRAELARAVLMHGPISRTELADRLQLSQPSLTRLSKPYLDAGLFIELDAQPDGSVGRPTRPLDIRRDAARIVGVKLTGEAAIGVLTDLRADVLSVQERPLPSHEVAEVVAEVAALVSALAAGGERPAGLGVTVGGRVARDRLVTRAPFLGWRDVELADLLEEATGIPTVVENDVVGLTEAEHWFGLARGLADFSLITIGVGVGYGLVVHDRVVSTPDTGLGLGGHIPLDPAGPRCFEGHPGCTTAMLSIPSIEAQAAAALGRSTPYEEVLELAHDDGSPVAPIVHRAAWALGRLMGLSANLTMQPVIVLSGDGIALWEHESERVLASLRADRDPEALPVEVRVDTSGFEAWSRGAAALAIQSYLGARSTGAMLHTA
ncbi:ROK family transcriptional regulator [Leifsonia sp. AG29]|uniref:ROK family transcriptional regulator n=1 Tax=Leifsonia sp. AG29 TaxID=2598860 RepID=UPI00131CAF69|nr:ROK family transcriptional regulator [Leifsonia sp. AG29]